MKRRSLEDFYKIRIKKDKFFKGKASVKVHQRMISLSIRKVHSKQSYQTINFLTLNNSLTELKSFKLRVLFNLKSQNFF